MTKKDYKTLAALIAYTQHAWLKGKIADDLILARLAQFIAEDAKLDHPRFDVAQFMTDALPATYTV
jgi:hypothetical protein